MSQQIVTWVLGVLATILGGTNLVTLVQLRSLRAKGVHEAEAAHIANLQTIIHEQGDEISRLSIRLEAQEKKTAECGRECEERIARLQEQSDKQQEQYERIINSLRAANVKGLNI